MLNFDMTGDATREVTDIEAAGVRTSTATPIKPNNNARNIPIKSRNNEMMFVDTNNAETGIRDQTVLTTGQRELIKSRKTTPGELADHVRNGSSLTQPPQTPEVKGAGKDDDDKSLQSFDFSGSQFRPPSDAENQKIANHEDVKINVHGYSKNDATGGDDWMYEDTEQEEFDDE